MPPDGTRGAPAFSAASRSSLPRSASSRGTRPRARSPGSRPRAAAPRIAGPRRGRLDHRVGFQRDERAQRGHERNAEARREGFPRDVSLRPRMPATSTPPSPARCSRTRRAMTPPPMMPMRMSAILPCGARCPSRPASVDWPALRPVVHKEENHEKSRRHARRGRRARRVRVIRRVPRPPRQADRAVGGRRRHRQHLPPVRAALPEAARPAGRDRERRRSLGHQGREGGEGGACRRLHAVCRPRLHPLDVLRRRRRRAVQRLRADLHDQLDTLGAHRESEDAVEDDEGPARRREGAPRTDHGRRDARLDQPLSSRRSSRSRRGSSSSTSRTRASRRG